MSESKVQRKVQRKVQCKVQKSTRDDLLKIISFVVCYK